MSTFDDFQMQGYADTQKEMEKLAKLIAGDYLDASKAVDKELKSMYAKYLTGISDDKYYDTVIKYNRLQNTRRNIEQEYRKWTAKAGVKMAKLNELAITNNYYRQYYSLSFIDGDIDLDFAVLNNNLVEASVYSTSDTWQKINNEIITAKYGNPLGYTSQSGTLKELISNSNSQALNKIRRELSSTLIRGQSYQKTSKSIRTMIGTKQIINGQEVYTGSLSNAMRIVRTEGNRNLNAGALASTNSARQQGMDIDRRWDATLDMRTRPAHGSADGRLENEDGLFYVGGEYLPYPAQGGSAGNVINCRCRVIDIVDGQAPTARRGRDPLTGKTKVFDYKTYDEWMTSNSMTQDKTGKWIPKVKKPTKKEK